MGGPPPLCEFKAGRMNYDGRMVTPDRRRGFIRVKRDPMQPGMVNFEYLDEQKNVQESLILFPDIAKFEKVKQTEDRVYLLEIQPEPRRLFFWMQVSISSILSFLFVNTFIILIRTKIKKTMLIERRSVTMRLMESQSLQQVETLQQLAVPLPHKHQRRKHRGELALTYIARLRRDALCTLLIYLMALLNFENQNLTLFLFSHFLCFVFLYRMQSSGFQTSEQSAA